MNKSLIKIFKEFHTGSRLNVYVLNKNSELITQFTDPLAPKLNHNIFQHANKANNELKIYFVSFRSNLAIFAFKKLIIVIWNPNYTIDAKGALTRKSAVYALNQFTSLSSTLYFMLYKQWPAQSDIKKEILLSKKEDLSPTHNLNTPSYKGYLTEAQMLDAISTGNLALFNQRFRTFLQFGNFGKPGSIKNRRIKDMTIAAISLFTRAAIKGGMPAKDAYNLSDELINTVEQDEISPNFYENTRAMAEIFIGNVHRYRRKNLSTVVYKAQEYIYENYKQIKNVEDISNTLNISLSYLQHIFKKETGLSLINFVKAERIKEAEYSLVFTNKSIAEIGNELGYNYTSQFSTIFRKEVGITPSQYRKSLK